MQDHFDIVVIGGGMAGASIGAELSPHARVLIAEAEDFPGFHATGRSAAFWDECYGGPGVVPLTLASGPWFKQRGFLKDRGALHLARTDQLDQLDQFEADFSGTGVSITRLGRGEMEKRVTGLREEWVEAIAEPNCADIDVGAVHQHYLAQAKKNGAEIRVRHRLSKAERAADAWSLTFETGERASCTTLVNAAGAWADRVSQMAGAEPLGIKAYRRTVVQLRVDPAPSDDLPLVLGIDGSFYFKPENGRLWLSPHDETLCEPCDAAPEEMDVALAIDRLQNTVNWRVDAVERKWAGLRSFAPDRLPVYGFDALREGFFWFAGQGGFGIQTAPAAARLACQLLLGLERDEMTASIDARNYNPIRFG